MFHFYDDYLKKWTKWIKKIEVHNFYIVLYILWYICIAYRAQWKIRQLQYCLQVSQFTDYNSTDIFNKGRVA